MEHMQKALDDFIDYVKNSETFKEYEKQKKYLQTNPELKQKVDEYREKQYVFQQRSSAEEIFEEADSHVSEMEEICKTPGVREFLMAELAYCRMIQKINDYLMKAFSVDFD